MGILITLLVNSFAVFITDYLLPGIHIPDLLTTVIIAVVLGVLNTFIKPILVILTLPVTLITFGLFVFVLNALMVLLASAVIPGFHVDGFWWALAFSLVLSIINSFLNTLNPVK